MDLPSNINSIAMQILDTGKDRVRTYGDPYPGVKTAAHRVLDRFRNQK